MTQHDPLTETLRRQRKEIDDSLESTSVRSAETESILAKIEELRRRSEKTQQTMPRAK